MTDDFFDAIEACKQNMLRSLDRFEQNMKNIYQQTYDNTRRQLKECYHLPFIEADAKKKQGEINQPWQTLNEKRLVRVDEENQDFPTVNLEEWISPIQEMECSISYIEHTQEESPSVISSPMEFEIPELLHLQGIDSKNCLEQYAVIPLPTIAFSSTTFATTKIATTEFSMTELTTTTFEFATAEIATSEVAINKQRISIIVVFDPGGISFLYLVFKACIATSLRRSNDEDVVF